MLKLLVDMNLSSRLAVLLREAGYDCQHWKEQGDPKAPDTELFHWARQHGAVLITRDLDFSGLLATTRFKSPSVLQIRCRDSHSRSVFPIVLQALRQGETLFRQGALIVVDENRLRIRTLPLIPHKL